MIYTSLEFMILLALTMAAYFALPSRRARLWLLIATSFLFYAWAGIFDFGIFLFVVIASYISAWLGNRDRARKKLWVTLGITVLVAHLFVWKYLPWINHLFGGRLELPLPVGISFFTLQGIAYLVDFAGSETGLMSLEEYLLFKSFFAQLIAGPITRAKQMLPYLRSLPRPTASMAARGATLFTLGLFKKLIIADHMALLSDTVFSSPLRFDRATLALASLAFYVQDWGDFSGYTDMGRGAAQLLGIELPRNFLSPLLAASPWEWARRWHVTLGLWLRDYLYVPLGRALRRLLGRSGPARIVRQLVCTAAVLLFAGLWHGAEWNFVLFGVYLGFVFGIGLLLRPFAAALRTRIGGGPFIVFSVLFGLVTTLIGVVFFRAPSLELTFAYFHAFVAPASDAVSLAPYAESFVLRIVVAYALEGVLYYRLDTGTFPVVDAFQSRTRAFRHRHPRLTALVAAIAVALVFVLSLVYRENDSPTAFIYFRF